ncbi:phospholipase A2-like [Microplitis mediator]|uniref:phospholipase A2-like n=1 Tax=Microplitis mediator TaxID=375433 RepID=UPI0025574B58|nr:phospholipase A2-like [Microplitis mediator]
MATLRNFGILITVLTYLLLPFSHIYAEDAIVESKEPELKEIQAKYSNSDFDESDQEPTRLSTIEKGLAEVKKEVGRVSSWIPKPIKNIFGSSKDKGRSATGFSEFVSQYSSKFRAIFPGTRWCGDGNVARSDDDLGQFKLTDACCRQHDKCPFNIGSGQSFGNLKNNGAFTRSWCACDQDFYNCLKSANNIIAREIGQTYFTVLGPQCVDYNYPSKCVKNSSVLDFTGRKCVEYKYDESQEQILQWKDNPTYVKIF